jgi:hypothetical protein
MQNLRDATFTEDWASWTREPASKIEVGRASALKVARYATCRDYAIERCPRPCHAPDCLRPRTPPPVPTCPTSARPQTPPASLPRPRLPTTSNAEDPTCQTAVRPRTPRIRPAKPPYDLEHRSPVARNLRTKGARPMGTKWGRDHANKAPQSSPCLLERPRDDRHVQTRQELRPTNAL